jgi:hypothetical protein
MRHTLSFVHKVNQNQVLPEKTSNLAAILFADMFNFESHRFSLSFWISTTYPMFPLS